jgi:hypothetical protein
MTPESATGLWVLLSYRLPREPSTPRITVWRKLKRLGVGQLGDGLVTLPADARTREQLEWIAAEIGEAGGEASLWLAQPISVDQEGDVAARMAAARAAEYQAVIDEVQVASAAGDRDARRIADRLQAELRRIARRDYFPPPVRDVAQAAVRTLRERTAADTLGQTKNRAST